MSRTPRRVVGHLAAVVALIAGLLLFRPSYLASAYVAIPPSRGGEETIRSDAVLLTTASRWKNSSLPQGLRADASAEALRRGLEVAKESGETRISFRSTDPNLAVYLANEITSTFLEVTSEIAPTRVESYPPFVRHEGPIPMPRPASQQIRLIRRATTAKFTSGRVLIVASLFLTFVVADFLLWMRAPRLD